jgi:hypothetical protein
LKKILKKLKAEEIYYRVMTGEEYEAAVKLAAAADSSEKENIQVGPSVEYSTDVPDLSIEGSAIEPTSKSS